MAIAVVADIGIDLTFGEFRQVRFRVVAGIGAEHRFCLAPDGGGLDHGEQQFLLRAGAMGLGVEDDLGLVIHGGDAGVALDHALAGGHLGRLVIGSVAEPGAALAALAICRVLGQPLADLGGFATEALPRVGGTRFVRFGREGIGGHLAFHHGLDGGFHLRRLPLEVGPRTALLLGSVRGQLDAVDGEERPPDQLLAVTHHQHLGEEPGHLVTEFRNEGGQRGEARAGVA